MPQLLKNIQPAILNHEMTRKEFIKYLGVFIVSVTFLGTIREVLQGNFHEKLLQTSLPKQTKGFGSGTYGGK